MTQTPGRWAGAWRAVKEALSKLEGDPSSLNAALRAAAQRQTVPVLWLLGSTQSGKTSIVRALTGSSRAEIGNGFQPCTRTAQMFDFPGETPVVRFLDTRGLGEVDYDPSEDIAVCESRAHLLIAVVRASDTRPLALLEVLRKVRKRHPEWPIVIVQTTLHEAYPIDQGHPIPYPFNADGWESEVSENLVRLLHAQRKQFAELEGSAELVWVPIDFTQDDDGYTPVNYGIGALWSAIESAASMGLQARLYADPEVSDAQSRASHPHIVGYSLAAAGLGALPVVDLALVPALQAKLLHTLAGIHQIRWTTRHSSEFFGLLGSSLVIGYGLRAAGRSLVKLIPFWGQTVGALWGASASGTITYALGKTACAYLARRRLGNGIEAERLREIYREALGRGRQLIREHRDETDS